MNWKGYQEEEELKQAEKKYGKNMYDLLFVNEWTCLLALFGQIFKNTNISWIQFSFYQYIKCLNLWSTNVKYKKKYSFFSPNIIDILVRILYSLQNFML